MKTQDKEWYQSSNFWTAVVLFIGGFFVGFPESSGKEAVALIFALVAIGSTMRNYIKSAVPKVREWINDANFWNYLATIIVALVPTFDPAILDALENVATGILSKNWQGVLVSLFSLATIIYKIATGPKEEKDPATA